MLAREFPKITIEQYQKFSDLIRETPNLLVATDIMKINRAVSYMSLFLKDIFAYLNSKGPDDTSLTIVRNADDEIAKYRGELDKLTNTLAAHGSILNL